MISPDVCPGRLDFEASVHERHFVSAIVRKSIQGQTIAGQRESRDERILGCILGKVS
jgi:hypothetical protein